MLSRRKLLTSLLAAPVAAAVAAPVITPTVIRIVPDNFARGFRVYNNHGEVIGQISECSDGFVGMWCKNFTVGGTPKQPSFTYETLVSTGLAWEGKRPDD